MSMTEKEAFTLGFLARCAEEGLTGAALDARLAGITKFNEKTAGGLVETAPLKVGIPGAGAISSGAASLADAFKAIVSVPIAGSILGGGALGYGAAKMVEPQIDDDEIKAQELAATYKLYADKAKNRKKVRQYRTGQGSF